MKSEATTKMARNMVSDMREPTRTASFRLGSCRDYVGPSEKVLTSSLGICKGVRTIGQPSGGERLLMESRKRSGWLPKTRLSLHPTARRHPANKLFLGKRDVAQSDVAAQALTGGVMVWFLRRQVIRGSSTAARSSTWGASVTSD